jgi:hypothetical protein
MSKGQGDGVWLWRIELHIIRDRNPPPFRNLVRGVRSTGCSQNELVQSFGASVGLIQVWYSRGQLGLHTDAFHTCRGRKGWYAVSTFRKPGSLSSKFQWMCVVAQVSYSSLRRIERRQVVLGNQFHYTARTKIPLPLEGVHRERSVRGVNRCSGSGLHAEPMNLDFLLLKLWCTNMHILFH